MGQIRDAMGLYVRGEELAKSRVKPAFWMLIWIGIVIVLFLLMENAQALTRISALALSSIPLWRHTAYTFYNRAATVNSEQYGKTQFASIYSMWSKGMLNTRKGETRPRLGHPITMKKTALGFKQVDHRRRTLRIGTLAHEKNIASLGSTGSGKTQAFGVPAARLWRSILFVDPKGELAATTARLRMRMAADLARRNGHPDPEQFARDSLVMLNPNGLHLYRRNGSQRDWMRSDGYHPLASIDSPRGVLGMNDSSIVCPPRFVDDNTGIATALNAKVAGSNEPFWNRSSIDLTAGMLMWECAMHDPADRSVGRVRQILSSGPEGIRAEARRAVTCGIQEIRNKLLSWTADKITTAMSNVADHAKAATGFLDIQDYRDDLARGKRYADGSYFQFGEMKETFKTIYLVLDPDQLSLDKGGTYGRLVIEDAVRLCMRAQMGESRRPRALIVWDEFPAFGFMPSVVRNAHLVRSYGLNFWFIAQSIVQLEEIYGRAGWNNLQGTCGTMTAFEAPDMETAHHLANMTGWQTRLVRSETMHKQPAHDSHSIHTERFQVFDADYIRRHMGRDTALVFTDDLPGPAMVRTTAAWKERWARELDDNPYHS